MASTRVISFSVLALGLAAVCVRLGVWQLERLEERQAANRAEAAQRALPSEDARALARSGQLPHLHRRVWLSGRYDYDRELVLTGRGFGGSPGVHLLTPLRADSGERGVTVLVNRGWVYAADGMTVDLSRWREADTATVVGYVGHLTMTEAATAVGTPSQPRGVRRLQRDSVAARLPYPIAPFYVTRYDPGEPHDSVRPARLAPPELTDGPHGSYAIQWFAFAAIAVVGLGFVLTRERQRS